MMARKGLLLVEGFFVHWGWFGVEGWGGLRERALKCHTELGLEA